MGIFQAVQADIHRSLDKVLERDYIPPGHRHYIMVDGHIVPASIEQWSVWFENNDNRVVAQTDVRGVHVSTVCLGINMNFGHRSDKRPVIFETMLFGGPYEDKGEYQWRYCTLEDARFAHDWIVECVLRGEEPEIPFDR